MKKIISILLSAMMVLQMSVLVFAEQGSSFAESTVLKDANGNNINGIADMEIVQVDAKTILYVTKKASATDTGVFAFDITDFENPVLIDSKAMANVNNQTRLEVFDFNGKSYLVASGSSICTWVWRINSDGTLESDVAASGIYLTWSNDMAAAGNTVVIVTDSINGHTPISNNNYEAYIESTCVFPTTTNYSYTVEFTGTTYTVPADYSSCSITSVAAREIGNDIYIATVMKGKLNAGALVEGAPAEASGDTEYFLEIRKKKMLNRWNNDRAFFFELISREKIDNELGSIEFFDDDTLISSQYSGEWGSDTVGLYKTEIDLTAQNAEDVMIVTPVVTQTSGIRVLPLDEDYFAYASRNESGFLNVYNEQTGKQVYRYKYPDSIPTALAEFNGNIYSTTEDGQLYVNYRASMDITSEGGEIFESEYTLKADFMGLPSDAVVKMKVGNDESVDVTSEISAGRLEKTIPVENGEYEIALQVFDGDNVVLEDSVSINVDVKPQISFENISVSGDTINFDVENVYSRELENCIVMALSYDDASMISKGKLELSDFSGKLTDKSMTLENSGGANTIMFAINSLSEPKLLSDIIYVSGNTSSFENITEDGAVSRISGKPNAMQEIDPITNKLTTKIANDIEKECNALLFVFNNQNKAWENFAFAYVGKTDAKGYTTIEYLINDNPNEGDVYYSTVAMGELHWKTNSNITKSYWGTTTVNQALLAISGANEDTILNVLTTHPCTSVLGLDFSGEYAGLEEFYQKNVLSGMAGKTFLTTGEAVGRFNQLIGDQSIIKSVNELTGDALISYVSNNDDVLGIDLTGLYTKLSQTQQKAVFEAYLAGKGFSSIEKISDAFRLGTALTFINNTSYISIIDNNIIETYYSDFGISETDKANYQGSLRKSDIIRTFLLNTISAYDDIKTAFSAAVNNPQSFENIQQGGGRPSGGSSGGGVSASGSGSIVLPQTIDKSKIDTTQSPKDPDDEIVFDDVKSGQWYAEAVYGMAKYEYINGVSEKSFAPDERIKREEFIKMIVSAFSLYDDFAETDFNDTSDVRWHYKYIASAQKAGIVTGNGAGGFGVGEYITREDMAVILARTIAIKGVVLENIKEDISFNDHSSISTYAVDSVYKMAKAGIINGYPENLFGAKDNATRAQATQLVWNIIK